MSWKVSDRMSERMGFVLRLKAGERMTDLCREFGISRKTGYKFWDRYQRYGGAGLFDERRCPIRVPRRTSDEIQELILAAKASHPTWGAKKLREVLGDEHPGIRLPVRSTIDVLLGRHGLVKRRKRRRKTPDYSQQLQSCGAPNELWCADFKGQFQLGNRAWCYPLTISDQFSRYLIGCEGLEDTRGDRARAVFEAVFREQGLPDWMRTDNGAPFASTGLLGLTRLSVWWLRLGIRHERIEPGHPEQNGRHERIHLTLKQETTRPSGKNLLQQQERFDRFREEYNHKRPHEALNMNRPANLYSRSARPYPEILPEPDYPLHDRTLRVRSCGHLNLGQRGLTFFLSYALAGERVGLREVEGDRWLVSFLHLDLGHFDMRTTRFEPTL
jgi:transposase InsO family protein